jgi:hypothetical protein
MPDTRTERLASIERTVTTMVRNLTASARSGDPVRLVCDEQRLIGFTLGLSEMALPMDGWAREAPDA